MDALLNLISENRRDEVKRSLAPVLEYEDTTAAEHLTEALRECVNADLAAIRFGQYLENCFSIPTQQALMASSPRYCALLAGIFSQSNYISEILLRHPEYGSWLWESGNLDQARNREEMLEEVLGPDQASSAFRESCRMLRRFRKREILRIAARDIFAHAPLPSITEDLSNLADASIEAALQFARAELRGQYGTPAHQEKGTEKETGMTVLAMGKLGGRELNFSSDIDLIFIYADDGETRDGERSISNVKYFGKLGELIIKALSEQTEEGFLYRVDMRLRPHGSIAPLATSLENAIEYYADFGRAWERQAMIKVRPCAGDIELGRTFIRRIRSFVFPRFFDDETLEDIRNVKRQAEAIVADKGKSDREVKLGRGGIRDIEFTVQMLQLLNAGRWPELRTPNTLKAITGLGRREPLSPFEADTLARNYIFLRHLEHRLQLEEGRQCHILPSDNAKLDDFAIRLGYESGELLMSKYRDRTSENRKILERFLATKGSGHLWVGDLLNPLSDGKSGLNKLAEMGFRKPVKAREELLALATGTGSQPFTRYVHQRFSEITPFLLNALSFTSDPDNLLIRLAQIMSRMRAPGVLYELLNHNPALCHFLVTLVHNSEYLSSILIREPGLLDTFGSVAELDEPTRRIDLEKTLVSLKKAVDSEAAAYRLRDGEMLRVALRELVRNIPVAKVGDELTQLAEVLLEDALAGAHEKVKKRYGEGGAAFTILGLGKLGGWEMGYGSDLDLLFVFEGGRTLACGMSPTEYYAEVAAAAMNTLKKSTVYGVLYDIDARLRPDGNKGVLAISEGHLADYFTSDAQPWERLALMKVRAVAGDMEFGKKAEAVAKKAAFSLPLNPETLDHIENLRQKMVAKASPLDLKKQEGGISEIEYTVRLWQLLHAEAYPELMRGDVFGALDILDSNGLVDPDESRVLRENYRDLRRILNRIRMMHGNQISILPEKEEDRAELAGRLQIDGDLTAYTQHLRKQVHAIYEKTRTAISG